MKTVEMVFGCAFVLALHKIAPVSTLDFWLVVVPVIVCLGLAAWSGYQDGLSEGVKRYGGRVL